MSVKLIGLDIGTTSICCVMLDAETGRVLDKMTKTNDSTIFTEEHFARCQDATAILDVVEEILQDFVKRDTDIAAIGISTQMHGILYVNALGRQSARYTPGKTAVEICRMATDALIAMCSPN